MHATRNYLPSGEQLTLWDDRSTATPDFMRLSLNQRRGAIVGDCRQLKMDTDSYNDNNPHGANIPMSYNIEPDLFEMAQPTDYPDAPPDDESDDESGNVPPKG
jgi:hypothetical protein